MKPKQLKVETVTGHVAWECLNVQILISSVSAEVCTKDIDNKANYCNLRRRGAAPTCFRGKAASLIEMFLIYNWNWQLCIVSVVGWDE